MQRITPLEVAQTACEVGEGLLWHPNAQLLLFLDIPAGIVYAYDPARNQHRLLTRGRPTGGMTLQEDGSVLLFQDRRIARLGLDGTLLEVASGLCAENERFNDVIADPAGRVFAGAMGGNGRLFCFHPDGRVEQIMDSLGIPNGMGFSPDLNYFYMIDSVPHVIHRFEYDAATGAISNREAFIEIPAGEGLPDGMTIDTAGFLWVAIWFGACLKRFAPDGTLDREIQFPVSQISSVTFGGEDFSDIFVTSTHSNGADYLAPPNYDHSARPRGGSLYKFRIEGVRGKPEYRSRLHL
jgi:D-xylonolactonase